MSENSPNLLPCRDCGKPAEASIVQVGPNKGRKWVDCPDGDSCNLTTLPAENWNEYAAKPGKPRAPTIAAPEGLKRYSASAVTVSETHFIPGPVPVYLASDVDALLPRTWSAEEIGGAPEGRYNTSDDCGATWETHWDDKKTGDVDTGILVTYEKADCVRGVETWGGKKENLRFFGPQPQPPKNQERA